MISSETEQRQLGQRVRRMAVPIVALAGIELAFTSLVLVNDLFKLFSRTFFLPPFWDAASMPLNCLRLGSIMLLLRHMLILQGRRGNIPEQQMTFLLAAQVMGAMVGIVCIALFVNWLLSLWLPWYVAWPVTILASLGIWWRFSRSYTRHTPESSS